MVKVHLVSATGGFPVGFSISDERVTWHDAGIFLDRSEETIFIPFSNILSIAQEN